MNTHQKTLEQVIMDESAGFMSHAEAAAIAAAVREWMREQNEGLLVTIYDKLLEVLPASVTSLEDCRKYTDAILSVIPPRRVQSAPDRERIKELEEEVARLKQKLEEEMRLTIGISDKAMAYDELREKFPFLPGEEAYALMFLPGEDEMKVLRYTVISAEQDKCRVIRAGNDPVTIYTKHLYPSAEACRAAIKVEE